MIPIFVSSSLRMHSLFEESHININLLILVVSFMGVVPTEDKLLER